MERMYNDIPEAVIQNGADIIEHIYNYALYLGWEVVDSSIVDGSSAFVVIKSVGGSKNNDRMPCYLRIVTNYTTMVSWVFYVYWDPITHSGAGLISYTTPTNYNAGNTGMYIDQNNNNVFHFRGNNDFIFFSNYRTSTTITYRSILLRIDNPFWNVIGHIQDSGPSTTATITLLDSEVDQFEIGAKYRMVSLDGHIDQATVFSKDTINNQMTIVGHTYPTASGAYIGTYPFPWVGIGTPTNGTAYNPTAMLQNTTSHYSTTASFISSQVLPMGPGMPGSLTYHIDYFNHNKVSLWPYIFYESNYGIWGHSSYLCYFNHGAEWDKFAVNVQDTGVVSSATSTTITGMSKNWIEDALAGMTLVITSGVTEEECRYIISNTSDVITFDSAINPTVSGAETFTVCDGVYTRYPAISARTYFGIKEV